MVHSSSSSLLKTAPSASPHQAELTSSSDSTLVTTLTPADVKSPVVTTIKASSTKSSPTSIGPSPQTTALAQSLFNGRTSGRKRTPKACDCCGPNSLGHNAATSSRGKGTPVGRGRGRGRGAGKDFGDTPKRKVGQLTVLKNFNLNKKKVQETEDGDDAQEKLQMPLQLSNTPSQTPVHTTVQATPKDGPIQNCTAPKKRVVQIEEDVLMPASGFAGVLEKVRGDEKDVDSKLLGQEYRGTVAVRGQGQGKAMTVSKIEGHIPIKSRGKGHGMSSRTGALAQSVLMQKQDSQMDQNDTDPVISQFGNGNMVNLLDMDGEMEDHSIIVCEPAVSCIEDLDYKMQVDHDSDQADQVSLSLMLPNGNMSPTDCDPTYLPVKDNTCNTATVPPPDPITVSSTEYLWALSDHKLYCQTGTWAKDETGEMLNKNQAEEGDMDTDLQSKERLEQLIDTVHDFLESSYLKYGSFTPLSESDVLEHLKKNGNPDINSSGLDVKGEMTRYIAALASAPVVGFMVTNNKHTLSLEDLSTLEDQNWLNDQIINMYGEIIMEATEHKVHFFNSFFYKQLVAKGYDGVKRWTKKVDLFSKWLLLIPIHLEIHWSLVTVTMATKTISYYDSQGIVFRHTTDNIMKYLQSEAREKKQTAFQKGWKITIIKSIPQQKNDSDCGVFVLEYCRCLSVKQPLRFSQDDMPRIRKRIYKELCDCCLSD
ncbi:uncharacterized protein LOC119430442 [Nematolebias whitei]|uniref:uncharacterized protein LOC119430442 n=1 Tax=Nematolebias whitei TaxID=451745 RepID=UPI001899344E|nr:uncharacterized protein LOC119430442 [Nematolebias whitei]